jgi:hypothetical protein
MGFQAERWGSTVNYSMATSLSWSYSNLTALVKLDINSFAVLLQ